MLHKEETPHIKYQYLGSAALYKTTQKIKLKHCQGLQHTET